MSMVDSDEMVDVATVKSKFTVTLPEGEDTEFLAELEQHSDVRGVLTLSRNYNKMLYHQRLADSFKERVERTAGLINGTRSKSQRKGDKKRSLRVVATGFYDSLSTPALRVHCETAGIDFDAYDDIDTVVKELVDRYLQMVTVAA